MILRGTSYPKSRGYCPWSAGPIHTQRAMLCRVRRTPRSTEGLQHRQAGGAAHCRWVNAGRALMQTNLAGGGICSAGAERNAKWGRGQWVQCSTHMRLQEMAGGRVSRCVQAACWATLPWQPTCAHLPVPTHSANLMANTPQSLPLFCVGTSLGSNFGQDSASPHCAAQQQQGSWTPQRR